MLKNMGLRKNRGGSFFHTPLRFDMSLNAIFPGMKRTNEERYGFAGQNCLRNEEKTLPSPFRPHVALPPSQFVLFEMEVTRQPATSESYAYRSIQVTSPARPNPI